MFGKHLFQLGNSHGQIDLKHKWTEVTFVWIYYLRNGMNMWGGEEEKEVGRENAKQEQERKRKMSKRKM